MKHRRLIDFAMVVHFCYPLSLIALCAYLLVQGDGWGAMIASVILGVPSLAALIGWLGLRKGRLWGWYVDVFSDLMLLGILIYSMLDDGWHNFEWVVAGLTFFPLVGLVFLFAPTVRKFYWQNNSMQSVQFSS